MSTLTIEITVDTERRLREEALRRNLRVEDMVAKLLDFQSNTPFPEEFFTTKEEEDFYSNAVHQYRDEEGGGG